MTRTLARVAVATAVALPAAAAVPAVRLTLWARRYEARTAEDHVYAGVLAAWTGVLMLALVTGAVAYWAVRRERRLRPD